LPPNKETGTRAKESWGPEALEEIRRARREFQDGIAANREDWIRSNEYFYHHLKRVLQFIVESGKRVLEVRCETGSFSRLGDARLWSGS